MQKMNALFFSAEVAQIPQTLWIIHDRFIKKKNHCDVCGMFNVTYGLNSYLISPKRSLSPKCLHFEISKNCKYCLTMQVVVYGPSHFMLFKCGPLGI